MLGDWLNAQIGQFFNWLWQWTQVLSFWIACGGGIILLDLFAVSKDKKFLKRLGEILVIYLIIRMIGAQS